MKLATFHDPDLGVPRVGLVTEDGLHPFAVRHTMRTLIAGGREVLDRAADHARAAEAIDLAEVELLAPLEPASVRDFVAFEEHVEGVRRSVDGVSGVPDAWYDA
ncbi:MAG TPA: hydroxylase, partial [Nocardioides sp.]